jgi:hypothetical protein
MGFFLAALLSLIVVGVVLLAVDVNMTHTRRIETQVARDAARIRRKTLQGWSAERIVRRYPKLAIEHVWRVRSEMARHIAADQEVRLLRTLWSMKAAEVEYER